tara:strand:- start:749 stop:1036 length:288 start_codon:yes stop_codon:yes gene_type:complete
MTSNQQLVTELYASNKKLNEKVQNLSRKVETDNKEMLGQLKELNSSMKCLLLQNKKLIDKIDKDSDSELKNKFESNKETMSKLLSSISKINKNKS